jgi:BASS family bile acid:Na+ symporter
MKKIRGAFLIAGIISALVLLIAIIMQASALVKTFAVAAVVCIAIGLASVEKLKGYQYTAWIIAAVVAGMSYPAAFSRWGSFDLRNKWMILVIVQMVMFGMGIQMSLKDFTGLAQTGKGVVIGLLCHFSIMPLMGFLLTRVFHFEPEIAAGIILIGSCSSGLASNVMAYIAKANLVLSVIVTAMATMAAPFFTPLLMKLLAGTLIKINVLDMMMEIIKIVIVPIGAALLHDYLKTASVKGRNTAKVLFVIAAIWLIMLPLGLLNFLKENIASQQALQSVEIFGFLLGAVVFGTLYHLCAKRFPKL